MNRHSRFSALAAAFAGALALVSGCSDSAEPIDDDGTDVAVDAIVHGSATTTAPWAVRIAGGGLGASCTASVLSKHWILTAAHCVETRKYEPLDVLIDYTLPNGTRSTAFQAGPAGAPPVECFTNPGFNSVLGTHDVALCS